MFYNYSLAGYFILLCVAFVATLNGLMIIKTRTFNVPLGVEEWRVDGTPAVRVGGGLVILGIASFVGLMWALFG